MLPPDPQLARGDVLRIFDLYQVYLCLGAAITTVGGIAGTLWALRRRGDPLLLWFSLFALLYGVRLILGYQLLWALGLRLPVFQRTVIALGFLLPIPGFFFFREMNLVERTGRSVLAVFVPTEITIAIATFFAGPSLTLRIVNNVAVLIALAVLGL